MRDIGLYETGTGRRISTWILSIQNRLGKVSVRDLTLVSTTDAERKGFTPEGMQDNLDKIVAEYRKGRCLVRPSGTEDCVRVYSETDTRD